MRQLKMKGSEVQTTETDLNKHRIDKKSILGSGAIDTKLIWKIG